MYQFVRKFKKILKNSDGFTLLELIIFAAIFSLVSIIFVAMLVSITGVQLKQTASSEVNRQSQFVLQTIQRYIENSSFIETTSTPTQSLLLRMPDGSNGTSSLVNIYWETSTMASTIYLKTGAAAPEAITSPRVKVDELTFRKFSRPGAHDSVSFVMALSYNSTTSTAKKFFQRLATTATRVSAATFDTSVVPPAENLSDLALGVSGSRWKSINEMLFFDTKNGENDAYFMNTGNVGIGINAPTYKFHVVGDSYFDGNVTVSSNFTLGNGFKIQGGASSCTNSSDRGNVRLVPASGGVTTDEVQVCILYENSYDWKAVSVTSTQL